MNHQVRSLVFLLLIGVTVAVTASRYQSSPPSIGAIGDVKYSVLDPEKFKEKNGEGWVLMDDRDIKGSDLHKLTGLDKLPDARGIFIRGMNLDRKSEEGDAEGNRPLGKYQKDSFAKHSHKFNDAYFADATPNCNEKYGKNWLGEKDGDVDNRICDNLEKETEPVGEKETRPRNIALYTYIKISN